MLYGVPETADEFSLQVGSALATVGQAMSVDRVDDPDTTGSHDEYYRLSAQWRRDHPEIVAVLKEIADDGLDCLADTRGGLGAARILVRSALEDGVANVASILAHADLDKLVIVFDKAIQQDSDILRKFLTAVRDYTTGE